MLRVCFVLSWVQWDESQGQCLGDFFLAKCAQSQFLTLKIMWNLGAEEAHAPKGSPQVARIQQMLKLAEMAHVNSEIPTTAHNGGCAMRTTSGGPVGAGSASDTPMRRSSTQELRQALKGSPGGTTLIAASVDPAAAAAGGASPASSAATPNGKPTAHPAYPLVKASSAPLVQIHITPAHASGGGTPNGPLVATQIRACVNRVGSNGAAAPGSSPPAARPGPSTSSPTLRASPTPAGVIPPHRLSAGPARSPSLSSSPPAHHFEPNDGLDPLQRVARKAPQLPHPQPHQPSQRHVPPHPAVRVSNVVPISLRSHPSSPAQVHSPLSGSLSSPPKSATPSTLRHATAEDDNADVFDGAAAAASVASVPSGSAGIGSLSPPDIEVDWPEADQDIPRASAAAPVTSATMTELVPQRKRSSTGRPPAKFATMGGKRATNGGGGGVVAGSGSAGSPNSFSPFGMDDPTLFHLLSKQVRSEYFNLELLLFSTLHDLSAALTKVALHDRNRVLREQLRNIDETIIRGLYFPMLPHGSLRHTHYRILRLLPEDCWTLASRDKAPFLLHCEISYVTSSPEPGRGHVSTFDNDIYTTYKSNAEIMREALALSGIAAQAPGGFGGATPVIGGGASGGAGAGSGGSGGNYPATPVTPSTGEASAAAQHTAAAIAAIAHAAGPLVVPPPPSVAPPLSVPPPTPIEATNRNLDANPAANVQANGLNIVSDDQDVREQKDLAIAAKSSSQTAPNSASAAEDASSELSKSQSSSSSVVGGSSLSVPSSTHHPLDSEGKPITRSRSSSQISSLKDSAHSLEQAARKTSASVSHAAAQADIAAATFHAQPDTKAWAASASAAPSTAAAVVAPATPAAASAAALSAAASSVPPSTTPSKPQRTVPPANPFKPRRASTYLTGPTLCDASFDTLSNAFGESFLAKKARVRASSPMAAAIAAASSPVAGSAAPVGLEEWDLMSVIFKGGDDLRQEVLAMQFIRAFDRIFRAAKLPLSLNPYAVIITSGDSGLIETIPDAVSIDSLKKRLYPQWTCLTDFFAAYFGGAELQHIILGPEEFLRKYPQGLVTYQTALRNFVESVAAYSVVCWILQIKDRHNGNIMLTRSGGVVHIDYGFMLSNSPGGTNNYTNEGDAGGECAEGSSDGRARLCSIAHSPCVGLAACLLCVLQVTGRSSKLRSS